ncbi:hypothetical protein CO178_01020 [candidate division WWE3 bacterium CG_4_9_14_3_um_filter_34_6]|uniref:Clp ATPase C-terminal domain-containing protein n=1 Tax=candidate division WWE3 bacterium CG_4_9_14_3_um_filter_34_6 TaxID=1975079 RepID=A0A2M7X4H0_UNCKA|nr:MAG: hypothetical protein CO178_01020 [candidate division WWE3 bacterium CG_4_9_14_3_um_filter_34_6]
MSERLQDALKSKFRPEFLNRIDDIVVFKPLGKDEIRHIVDIEIGKLSDLLIESDLQIELTLSAKNYLVDNGYSIEMGARPLKRLIQKEIENRVSEAIINGEAKNGSILVVDSNESGIIVMVKEEAKVFS